MSKKDNITAAEFKRRHMNRAAQASASTAVQTRVAINGKDAVASAADKRRVQQDWRNRNQNPAWAYRPGRANAGDLHSGANRSHLVVSI